jgi:hypothetical protein
MDRNVTKVSDPGGHAVCVVRLQPLDSWNHRFETLWENEYSSRLLYSWRPVRRADHSFTGVQPGVFLIVCDVESQPRGGLSPISVFAPQKDCCISGCQPSPLTLRTPISSITSHGKGLNRPPLIFLPGCICWEIPVHLTVVQTCPSPLLVDVAALHLIPLWTELPT